MARDIPRAEEILTAYAVAFVPVSGLLVQIPEAVIIKHGPDLIRREADGSPEVACLCEHCVELKVVQPGEDSFLGGPEASCHDDLADVFVGLERLAQHCSD